MNNDPVQLFTRWFVNPIEKLKELPDGDGGFAAMMIAIPLYERYLYAKLKLENIKSTKENIKQVMSQDLNLTLEQCNKFWNTFRVGFMHRAMPKGEAMPWLTSSDFNATPDFRIFNGQTYICIDPWKFADRVLNKFSTDQRLITASENFPFASMFFVPK